MSEFRWYVAASLAGLESTACYHLSRAGITAYAPTVADRAARFFPGYVFVELAGVSEAGIVNRTRGIRRMLPVHTEAPLPLPRGFVDEFRERIAAGEFDDRSQENLLKKFLPGDSVLWSGPLADACRDGHGRFLRYQKGCGVVLGYLLGRELEIPIPLHQIFSAPERALQLTGTGL